MATIIKQGSPVHAGYRAASGAFVGSECRIKGIVAVVEKTGSIYVKEAFTGSLSAFPRDSIHHLSDCPRSAQ